MSKIIRSVPILPETDPKKLKAESVSLYNDRLDPEIKNLYESYQTETDPIKKIKLKLKIINLKKIRDQHKKAYEDNIKLKTATEKVDFIKKQGLLDIAGWQREWADRKKPHQSFIANFELRNGMFASVYVKLSKEWFDYEDGRYIIDDDLKYYSVSSKCYMLDYHQDCAIPLRRRFNVNLVKEQLANSNNDEIQTETAINPTSLKIFMESDIIQKIMKGAEMEQWIKFIKLMLIVIVVICAVILLILLKLSFGK